MVAVAVREQPRELVLVDEAPLNALVACNNQMTAADAERVLTSFRYGVDMASRGWLAKEMVRRYYTIYLFDEEMVHQMARGGSESGYIKILLQSRPDSRVVVVVDEDDPNRIAERVEGWQEVGALTIGSESVARELREVLARI